MATMSNTEDHAIAEFREAFGSDPEITVDAPGRVNLIGGSTDYNEGLVLPVAIDRSVRLLAKRSDDAYLTAYSSRFPRRERIPISGDRTATGWLRFLSGILLDLSSQGHKLGGLNLLIDGNLPMASGLGSSAALEVGFLHMLRLIHHLDLPDEALIGIAHRVENDFIGMKCGFMDQVAVTLGRKGKAILLDCRDLSRRYISFNEGLAAILLFDSGVKRELARSDYNRRRSECEEAVRIIRGRRPEVRALRDLTPVDLPELEHWLSPTLFRRCRHVVTEINRVKHGAAALEAGEFDRIGEILEASHASLRDDFEVSCPELDYLFEAARGHDEVFGARLTGAGFGGMLLALCRPGAAEEVAEAIRSRFRGRFGRDPAPLVCRSADGVRERWL